MNKAKKVGLVTLLIFLVLGLTVFLVTYLYVFRTDHTDMSRLKTDFSVSATSLFTDFNTDEAAAMEKFAGKVVEVSGVVESVEKNEWGNVTISFVDPFFGVTCTIDSLEAIRQSPLIDQIKNGDSLIVKGRCDGMLTDVKIVKCLIVN